MQIAAGVGSSLFGGIQAAYQTSALNEGLAENAAIAHGFSGAVTAAIVIGIAGFITALFFSSGLSKKQRGVQS